MPNLENIYIGGEILLYGPVGNPYGWGEGFTPTEVAQALAEHGDGDVTVRLNSPGGIAFDGMAIYALLRAHALANKAKVNISIDGIAASAASLIAMAGDTRAMRGGALLMIHDASGITWGTAADHQKSAEMLDKLSAQYGRVYADRSGKDQAAIREMMLAETWLSAEEAVTAGLATEVISEAATAFAPFTYEIYAKAPAGLPARAARPGAAPSVPQPAALAAQPKEAPVPKDNIDPGAGAEPKNPVSQNPVQPIADARAWVASFYAAAEVAELPLKDVNAIVAEAKSLEDAQAKLIGKMAEARNGDKPKPNGGHIAVGAEAGERFKEGVTRALMFKTGMKDGERNEFTSFSLRELARASLAQSGRTYRGADPTELAKMAMMSGSNSSSDFTQILSNVANKAMLTGVGEAEETFQSWTSTGTLVDFKQAARVDLNVMPSLALVAEGGEYLNATTGERAETTQLAKYGQKFPITYEAIVNDDLDVFSKVPRRMGRAAVRTVGNLVYAVLTSNPLMADGTALFANARGNNANPASALSEASLDAARTAMARRSLVTPRTKGAPDEAVTLNIRPRYLIVPVTLEGLSNQLMNSRTSVGQANPQVASRVQGLAQIVSEARLDNASLTAWYLAASASDTDTIEVAYLNGQQTPTMTEEEGFDTDGVTFKIRMVAGVKALGHFGLYRNTGV